MGSADEVMEFTIALESPFSLEFSLESGQVFRWENRGEWWYGVVGGGVLKAKQEGDVLRCVSSSESIDSVFVRTYFRLDEDQQPIIASIMKDGLMAAAVQRFYGLRIIRQDFWECLASFVLATNSNIPRIKKMVSTLASRFGAPFEFEGLQYATFPTSDRLAEATVHELRECGLGYRAPFLKRVAESVDRGRVSASELSLMDYERAHATLIRVLLGEKVLLGVGPKVADCVLLYSCGKDDAFPIDVWVAREMARSYPQMIGERLIKKLAGGQNSKLTRREYLEISIAARSHFGRYAGHAQQYLFMTARERE